MAEVSYRKVRETLLAKMEEFRSQGKTALFNKLNRIDIALINGQTVEAKKLAKSIKITEIDRITQKLATASKTDKKGYIDVVQKYAQKSKSPGNILPPKNTSDLKIPSGLLSPELWDDNKTKVKALIKNHLKKKLAAGITDHNELRKGLEPFNVGDKTFEIRQVNKFIESIKDPTKKGDIQLIDQEYRVRKNQREELLKQQTDTTGAADATGYGRGKRNLLPGQQDHHLRFRSLLEPFYENLDEKQARQLTQWFLENEFPIGNVVQNLEGIDQDLHQVFDDSIHTWAKDNQIDVGKFKDTTGTNFKTNKKGQLLVAGGAGGEVIDTGKKIPGIQGPQIPENIPVRKAGKAKFPYLGDMPLNERFTAATLWMNTVEEPLLNKTAEIMERQDLRRFGKGSTEAKTKAQWLEKWNIEAQDVGAKARILADNPGLDPKLFNPKILKSAKLAAKMSKIATGAGTAEAGVMLASGQVVPGSIALAMQTPAVQKQVAKLLLKQGVKLIPGLSFGGGLLQGAGYAASGRPLKATASVLGGIVGEIPGIGDVAQSMIDLGLTVDDVRVAKQKAKTKKPELEVNEKGFMHTPIDESTDPAFAKTVKDLGEDVSQFDTSGFKGSTRMDDILKTSRKLSRGVMKGF